MQRFSFHTVPNLGKGHSISLKTYLMTGSADNGFKNWFYIIFSASIYVYSTVKAIMFTPMSQVYKTDKGNHMFDTH